MADTNVTVQGHIVKLYDNGDNTFTILPISGGKVQASSVLTAGSAIVGKFGIDQTTDGTTNKVAVAGTNAELDDSSVSWENSDSSDTEKNVDIANPTRLHPDGLYVVLVNNPSTETALTVTVKNVWEDSGANTNYATLTSFSVATESSVATIVQGMFIGDSARITLSNDTGLTGAGAFTGYVQTRRI